MTARKQRFGHGSVETKHFYLLLCIDADEPELWTIHWYPQQAGGEDKDGVMTFRVSIRDKIYLRPHYQWAVSNEGGIHHRILTQEEQNARDNILVVLTDHQGSLIGDLVVEGKIVGTIDFPPVEPARRVKAVRCKTWSSFKKWADSQASDRFNRLVAFRGHGDRRYSLSTSLARTGRTRLERYVFSEMPVFRTHAEVFLNRRIDMSNPEEVSMLYGLAQHHGLPTPLLDWSESPYVAAFFAFADALEFSSEHRNPNHVRIYGITQQFADDASVKLHIAAARPYVSFFNIGPLHNPRLLAQQGKFVATNVADLEDYLVRGENDSIKILYAVDIPVGQAATAMADLARMGLTSGTLFPGLDGLCRMLRQKMLVSSKVSGSRLRTWGAASVPETPRDKTDQAQTPTAPAAPD